MATGWQRALLAPTPDTRRAGILGASCALRAQRHFHGEGRGLWEVGLGGRGGPPSGRPRPQAQKGEVNRGPASGWSAPRPLGRLEANDLLALT